MFIDREHRKVFVQLRQERHLYRMPAEKKIPKLRKSGRSTTYVAPTELANLASASFYKDGAPNQLLQCRVGFHKYSVPTALVAAWLNRLSFSMTSRPYAGAHSAPNSPVATQRSAPAAL